MGKTILYLLAIIIFFLVFVLMDPQDAFSISISNIDWGLTGDYYKESPHAVFYYSFRYEGDSPNRFYTTGFVEDPNGATSILTPRKMKLLPGQVGEDLLTWSHGSRTFPDGQYSAQITIWKNKHDFEENKNPLFTDRIYNAFVIKNPPKLTYHNTFLSLQVRDSSSQGYIQVKPTLIYGSSNTLSTTDISIFVDGNYKTKVSSNQWSHDIKVGDDSHTIKASVAAWTDKYDSLIKYRASSSGTVDHFVEPPGPSGPGVTSGSSGSGVTSGGSGSGVTSSGSGSGVTSSENFTIGYVIVGVVVVAAAAGVGIALSKRKKIAPVISVQPAKVPAMPGADDTQFWVCPNCGNDTQMKDERQYCPSCRIYL